MDELSIVIPVLNEKKNLYKLTNEIRTSLKKKIKYEVIIVDDNSNDGSHAVLVKLEKRFKNLSFIIRKNKKKDLSNSCIDGFKKSKYGLILVMDGDLQHNPKDIYKLYNTLVNNNLDVVIGDRALIRKKNNGLSILRFLSSILINHIVHLLLGFKTNDPMSGFFIFKKKLFIKNKFSLYANGYKILLDLIYSSQDDLKIKDVYIKFKKRLKGSSKIDFKMLYHLGLIIITKFFLRLKYLIFSIKIT